MFRKREPHPPLEENSWALSWQEDRREDKQRLRAAFGCAILVHAALLAVRLADEPVVLPPVDAIIHPQLENLAIKKPEPPAPRAVERAPEPAAVRVPVPVELAPPEPLPIREAPVFPVELPPLPAAVSIVPVPPPPVIPEAPVRFTGEMERPVRIAGLDPTYTEVARKVRKEGTVILDAVIAKSGEVTDLEVLKGLGFGLTESAVRAVGSWRFEPARLAGRPVAVRYTLTVRFSLR